MKTFNISLLALTAVLAASFLVACDDADEYKDAETDNPSWITDYTDSASIVHPESLSGTTWVRGTGLKVNAYGEEVQGFVESMIFTEDSVKVTMSEGTTSGTWVDDSNTDDVPYYEYTYSSVTGKLEVLKRVTDDSGKVSKSAIFIGIAVVGTKTVLTVVHYGDTPVQTYLVMSS